MAIGHTRTGHELFRREQAPLHEELADRQRAFRDTRFGSIHKVKELKRDQEFRRIFEKKNGRKSFQRCRICTQWINISRSKSTSVISSSSWTRRIANSRLQFAAKHMGYAWYIGKRFCKSTSVLFDNLFRNAQSLDFSITGNIPVQASTGRPVIENGARDNSHSRAPKMAKNRHKFSIFRSFFLMISEETVDWNSNALPEEESRSLGFQWKRYKENIWGKAPEERPCAQSIWKTISTAVLAWMVIAQLHLLVNSAISVLGCTIRLMNCQAEAKSDWNSVATLNVHDNWLRMLQDDEPPKSSWRPRKSTKSWVELSVQKFTRVTQSRKKKKRSIAWENWSNRASWRGGHVPKIRDAPAEKRRESKVQRCSTNLFLNAVLREMLSSFQRTLHNLSHIMLANVWS